MRARGFSYALLLLAAGTARAEICYSDAHDASVPTPPRSSTPFNCPLAGRKTLTELAAAGYVVVKMSPLTVGQAGPVIQQATQLIIELPETVFRNGFE